MALLQSEPIFACASQSQLMLLDTVWPRNAATTAMGAVLYLALVILTLH